MGGTVDVHAHVKIRAMHGEKVNSISGRLTVLHEFVADDCRMVVN